MTNRVDALARSTAMRAFKRTLWTPLKTGIAKFLGWTDYRP